MPGIGFGRRARYNKRAPAAKTQTAAAAVEGEICTNPIFLKIWRWDQKTERKKPLRNEQSKVLNHLQTIKCSSAAKYLHCMNRHSFRLLESQPCSRCIHSDIRHGPMVAHYKTTLTYLVLRPKDSRVKILWTRVWHQLELFKLNVRKCRAFWSDQ